MKSSSEMVRRNSSLERGADVLLMFTDAKESQLGVTEIAGRLNLSKAVVHRILSALRAKGFVEFDPGSRRYSLGPMVMSLGLSYLQKLDVRTAAMSELTELSRVTHETATLSVRSGATRLYVEQVTPRREVLMSVSLGVPYPLHAGASSKALLAFLPHDDIDHYLESPLTKVTANTVTDRRRLRRELAVITQRGWASSIGERQAGAASVAAPIFDYRDQIVAVASVCGPAERLVQELDGCVGHLIAATNRISRRLGFRCDPDQME